MTRRYSLIVHGKHRTWSFTIDAYPAHVDDWRADGLIVDELIYSIPKWAVDAGLTRVWCRCSDVFNFRRPWPS